MIALAVASFAIGKRAIGSFFVLILLVTKIAKSGA